MSPSADLLLHPVRLRIVQSLLGGRECTTAELCSLLPDVPTTTLYRHVARLALAGVLRVTAERPVRGVTERTYGLDLPAAQIDADAVRALSVEDHRRLFGIFVAGLLGDFDRYLDRESVDLIADNAGYRQNALWLTDDEYDQFTRQLSAVFAQFADNQPGQQRRRRLLSLVTLPVDPPEETR